MLKMNSRQGGADGIKQIRLPNRESSTSVPPDYVFCFNLGQFSLSGNGHGLSRNNYWKQWCRCANDSRTGTRGRKKKEGRPNFFKLFEPFVTQV